MVRNLFILVSLVLAAPSQGQAEQRLSLELGGWTTGLEYETPWGAFADLHCPWALVLMEAQDTDLDWAIPMGGRLGYAFSLDKGWSIRAAFRADLMWWQQDREESRIFLMMEIGARWQHPSGFRVGFDLVPLGWLGDDMGPDLEFWFPSILMSQASVGWSWSL